MAIGKLPKYSALKFKQTRTKITRDEPVNAGFLQLTTYK